MGIMESGQREEVFSQLRMVKSNVGYVENWLNKEPQDLVKAISETKALIEHCEKLKDLLNKYL